MVGVKGVVGSRGWGLGILGSTGGSLGVTCLDLVCADLDHIYEG